MCCDHYPKQCFTIAREFREAIKECMHEANNWAEGLNGDKNTIECCSMPLVAEPCMKEKCSLPSLVDEPRCHKALILPLKEECLDSAYVTRFSNETCSKLKRSWLWVVVVATIVLVILAIAVLIYIVYSRKFGRQHKHKGQWSFGDKPNVETKGKKVSKHQAMKKDKPSNEKVGSGTKVDE